MVGGEQSLGDKKCKRGGRRARIFAKSKIKVNIAINSAKTLPQVAF
jgi:hypothetical protein